VPVDVANFICVGGLPGWSISTSTEFLVFGDGICIGVDCGAVHCPVEFEWVAVGALGLAGLLGIVGCICCH
jgi:hypothetical protein